MHQAGKGNLQTEWAGWFAEFLVAQMNPLANNLLVHGSIPAPHRLLDAYLDQSHSVIDPSFPYSFPVDIKTSANYQIPPKGTQPKQYPKEIILNDEDMINNILTKYNRIGFMLISGIATPDIQLRVKSYLAQLRRKKTGKAISTYAANNRAANKKSRLLKETFTPIKFEVFVYSTAEFHRAVAAGILTPKNQPGLNSNGKPRPRKYNLNLKKAYEHNSLGPVFSKLF